MKDNISNQFKSLKSVIDSNIKTLDALIEQSKQLETLAQNISDTEAQSDTKEKLSKLRDNLNESIKELVDQTSKLFETYQTLLHELYK